MDSQTLTNFKVTPEGSDLLTVWCIKCKNALEGYHTATVLELVELAANHWVAEHAPRG